MVITNVEHIKERINIISLTRFPEKADKEITKQKVTHIS